LNICVIGDSHVTALKGGLPSVAADYPECNLVFFAGPGGRLKDLEVSDGKLTASSAELADMFRRTSGADCIEPKYDAYILVGLAVRIARAASICLRAATQRWRGDRNWILDEYEMSGLMNSGFEKGLAEQVMAMLRQITDAPTVLIATPYPGDTISTDFWKRLDKRGVLDRLPALYEAACVRLCAAYDVRFLSQPPETIAANGVTTQSAFTRAASTAATRRSDGTHMNARFGALVLKDALAALSLEMQGKITPRCEASRRDRFA